MGSSTNTATPPDGDTRAPTSKRNRTRRHTRTWPLSPPATRPLRAGRHSEHTHPHPVRNTRTTPRPRFRHPHPRTATSTRSAGKGRPERHLSRTCGRRRFGRLWDVDLGVNSATRRLRCQRFVSERSHSLHWPWPMPTTGSSLPSTITGATAPNHSLRSAVERLPATPGSWCGRDVREQPNRRQRRLGRAGRLASRRRPGEIHARVGVRRTGVSAELHLFQVLAFAFRPCGRYRW